jgi:hypothetical protein
MSFQTPETPETPATPETGVEGASPSSGAPPGRPGDEGGTTDAGPGQEASSSPRWRRLAPPVLVVAVYCLLGGLAYGFESPISNTALPPCACNDLALQAWFQAWPAHAIAHGLNPFISTAVNYPRGVNLMSNTGAPLLGIVFAPVTWLFGPAAALNLVMRLGFALSAISMFFVLRRWARWWPAAFAGGLLYGFSPYVVGQAQGHDFLMFVPFPPLILALLDELVIRRRHLVRNGMVLGVVVTAQLLISPEVLSMCALAVFGGLVVVVARHPVAARQRAGEVLVGLGAAAVTFVVLAAYPLWVYLSGPYHVSGPQHPIAVIEDYHTTLESLFLPNSLERFGTAGMFARGDALAGANAVEHAVYLGLPLLCILLLIAWRFRRMGVVQLMSAIALGSWVVTLGPFLYVGQTPYPQIKLPYDLIKHIPLINAGIDVRYALVMYLALAVVLAVGLDRWRADGLFAPGAGWRRRVAGPWSATPRARAGLGVALAVIGLVPLVPSLPYTSTAFGVPSIFTAAGSPVANGAVVLSYPLPVGYENYADDQALLWQAEAGMRFRLIGFRGAVAGPHHKPAIGAAIWLPPTATEALLVWSLYGQPYPPPVFGPATSQAIRTFLARYHVDDITIVPSGAPTGTVLSYFDAALGRPPSEFQGSYVWSGVQQLLASGHASG